MSSDILNNLNPGIEDLHPYEPGRSIDEVVAEFGHNEVVKLASNENPLGASPKALSILAELENDLHLYPDGNGTKLKEEIANHENVPFNSIIIGNGSNEILELAARAFLNPSTSSIASKHAFAVYKIVTQSAGASLIEVPTCNWGHNLESFEGYLESSTRVIFIANPNNPTGTYNSHQEVHSLLKKVPSSVLVVLDCAYFEYVTNEDYVKPLDLLNEFDNLLITKSFSKIHGLASIRVGYGIASPSLIEVLNRIRQPFNVNTIAQAMACIAINDHEHIHRSIELNTQQYKFLFDELSKLGLECIPSVGNFITFTGNFIGKEMFNNLMKKGVIIRSVDLYDMKDFLRVTIGTESENLKFLSALEELL
ncbi:histidinol-phosphate transaminase [Gammaproteobacteria bacterium]|nr:histidinol-phosphate transaminase [Gammaproteobacteria bacterium]